MLGIRNVIRDGISMCRSFFTHRSVDPGIANINKLTLKFHDDGVESGFVQNRKQDLAHNTVIGCRLFMLMASGLIFNSSILFNRSREQAWEMEQLKICIMVAVMLVAFFNWMWAKYQPSLFESTHEIVITASLIIGTTMVIFYDSWYLCRLRGIEPTPEYLPEGQALSDSKILLLLDAVITFSHLTLPVRWYLLAPLEFVALFLYGVCCLLGSPESHTGYFNFLVLASIAFFSALGKRTIEQHERRAFSAVLREKRLRFQTEFQLELIGAPKQVQHDSDTASATTGNIFDTSAAGVSSDLTRKLEQIAAVGHKEQWLIDRADLRIMRDDVLGSGGFGVVVGGFFCEAPVAVKMSKKSDSFVSGQSIIDISNEVRVLRRVRHPNVVLFHGAYVDPHQCDLALVLERVDGILLSAYVHGHISKGVGAIDEEHQQQLSLGICYALNYLHTRMPAIVHADLKPSNIAVEASSLGPRSKLLDFGLSRILQLGAKSLGRTMAWAAPEVLLYAQEPAHMSADVFGFGCVLYFLATGKGPRQGQTRQQIMRFVKRGGTMILEWPCHSAFLENRKAVVAKCCQHHCHSRPTIQDSFDQLFRSKPSAELGDTGEPASAEVMRYVRQRSGRHKAKPSVRMSDEGLQDQFLVAPEITALQEKSEMNKIMGYLNWLTSMVLDCDISSKHGPVRKCIFLNSGLTAPPNGITVNLPAFLAHWMQDDDFHKLWPELQTFFNLMINRGLVSSRVGIFQFTSVLRDRQGVDYSFLAFVEFLESPFRAETLGSTTIEDTSDQSTSHDSMMVRLKLSDFKLPTRHLSPTRRGGARALHLTPIAEGRGQHLFDL